MEEVAFFPDLLDAATVAKLDGWTRELEELEGVEKVTERIGFQRPTCRYEHFVHLHAGWESLVRGPLQELASRLLGEPAVPFKEKLNLKPPQGRGFAAHQDHPSLAHYAPHITRFLTVMVAIDAMSEENGCLELCAGRWEEGDVELLEAQGDPEVGGRAGGITPEQEARLSFEPRACEPGAVLAFHGWVPHRSGSNNTEAPRRAIFVTYNAESEAPRAREEYYERLYAVREAWAIKLREEMMVAQRDAEDHARAMSTIPKGV